MISNWMNINLFLFLMFLNQSIVSKEFFHIFRYLELLRICDVILRIKFLDTKPSSVLVGLISPASFLSWKFCLWSLNKM